MADDKLPDWAQQSANLPAWVQAASQKDSATQTLDLVDVPGQAVEHLGESAKRFGETVMAPVAHPVETAKNLGKLAAGGLQKAQGAFGLPRSLGTQYEPYADAVGRFFKDRYGGWDNIKRTMAQDPVGFAADIATVASGTEALRLGKLSEVAGQVGKFTDPLRAVPALAKPVTEGVGVLTGKGGEGFRGLVKSGFAGGREAETATRNLRDPQGNASAIVQRARMALSQIASERSAEYKASMAQVGRNMTPLSFNDVDAAIARVEDIGKLKGKDIAKALGEKDLTDAQQMLESIKKNVAAAKADPNFHDALGFDALKKHIGDKVDWKTRPDAANKVAKEIYHAVRDTIAKQDPAYAEAMQSYQQATDLLDQVERTLSLGKKASEDTALRKLLSTTRSDVNTNFGQRLKLADELNKRDPSILPALYGQAYAPYAPGGLARGVAGGGGVLALAEHGKQALLDPKIVAALLSTSPRLWGELGLGTGKLAGKVTPQMIMDAIQAGYPAMLSKMALGARAAGGANAAQ